MPRSPRRSVSASSGSPTRYHRRDLRRSVGALALAVGLAASLVGCGEDDEPTVAPTPEPQAVVAVPADAATIGEALDLVAPGGMVLVSPGTYREEVTVDVEDVTLRGTDRGGVVIDGEGQRSFGVVATADGVRVENLTVRSTLFYGVLVTSMHDENGPIARGGPGYTKLDPEQFPPLSRFSVSHVTASNNGLYGIYAFNARNGVIEENYASGSADSGYYVGQCTECNILVRNNVAERNAIGFENANASDSLTIVGNRFSHNRVGLTLTSNYQEAFTPQKANVVAGNLVSDNAEPASPEQALGGFGIGIGITGGTENLVQANRIEGNPGVGVMFSNTEDIGATGNQIRDNVFSGNGVDLGERSADRAPATGNCVQQPDVTAFPFPFVAEACDGAESALAQGSMHNIEVPDGISFLRVEQGPDQPAMADVETKPGPLPDTVDLPDPASIEVPSADLLVDRSGAGR